MALIEGARHSKLKGLGFYFLLGDKPREINLFVLCKANINFLEAIFRNICVADVPKLLFKIDDDDQKFTTCFDTST